MLSFPTGVSLSLVFSCLVLKFLWNPMFGRKKWNPEGQHCYVTGGSQGTGLALASSLVKQGAHVSIVAQTASKLKDALAKLEEDRQNPDQIIRWYAQNLSTHEGAAAALEDACRPFKGRVPDVIFNCAGISRPRFFIEETAETFKAGMDNTYWLQAYTTLVASKLMVRQRVKGKVVFVGSTLAYFSMVGYTSYSPGKFAVRALAETLRNEFKLYGISVHMYYPCSVYSPGYIEENKTKPAVTNKIEELNSGVTPEQAAEAILQCVRGNKFQHASDFYTKILRAGTRGTAPGGPFDFFLDFLAWIVMPATRLLADYLVRAHRAEHEVYLQSKGFYETKD